jgi:Mrp family chromosome partitioning ATPase
METKRGKVITFYSYKGGTGRSMALANAACLLARRSDVKRVLAIDWDLDAPGLHHYFSTLTVSHTTAVTPPPTRGVIDLFTEIGQQLKQRASQKPLSEEEAEGLLASIAWDNFITDTGLRNVDLLAAGRIDVSYPERVAEFDWRGLFDSAPSLIRVFAERVAQRYDYVLIDSRTGLNDISGICTALLPDQLVFVFTPNSQSIDGGIEVLRRATAYRRESEDLRPLVVFPLQSRIEMSEPDLFSSWRFGTDSGSGPRAGYQGRFEKLFAEIYGLEECDLKSYFDEVQIQHVPRYSYGEDLAAVTERAQGGRLSLSRSYAAFVDVLTNYDVPWSVAASTERGAELVGGLKPTQLKVNAAKEYISDERARVKLHDLVADEVRRVVGQTHQIAYQGHWSVEEFEQRLRSYETSCNDLLHIEAVLAFWGNRDHQNTLVLGPKRVVAHVRPESGLTIWLAMRWYPAMLVTYAGGIAAVAGTKYENLFSLFSVTVPGDPDERDLVRALGRACGELHRPFEALPDYSKRYTPRSDYLYALLEPVLDSVVFIGSDYQDAFERFELMFALEYVHRAERLLGRVWAPPGRFGWRFRSDEDPLSRLLKEFELKGSEWEPLKAGLFGGSQERFAVISAELREFVGKLGFY